LSVAIATANQISAEESFGGAESLEREKGKRRIQIVRKAGCYFR
jgi:hypothetical protein